MVDFEDGYTKWMERNEKPLAELRAKNLMELLNMKDMVPSGGVAIGISPTDRILEEYSRGEITDKIRKIFNNMRVRGSDGHLVPVAPLTLFLIGEYSPNHRWHYHGVIIVENILVLEKIKKVLRKHIGRTVTEQIRNEPDYVDYMFKQYMNMDNGIYYMWDKKECYLKFERYRT